MCFHAVFSGLRFIVVGQPGFNNISNRHCYFSGVSYNNPFFYSGHNRRFISLLGLDSNSSGIYTLVLLTHWKAHQLYLCAVLATLMQSKHSKSADCHHRITVLENQKGSQGPSFPDLCGMQEYQLNHPGEVAIQPLL